MLIGQVYIKDNQLILRDVDGSEVALSLSDALHLLNWLVANVNELKEAVRKQSEKREEQQP